MTAAATAPLAQQTVTPDLSLEQSTGFARARIGLIIPSVNHMTEPQFRRFAPPDLGIHVTRLQMTGPYRKPLPELLKDMVAAARMLADAQVNLIVFHCTAVSMEHGPEGDARLVDTIKNETGIPTLSTGQAIVEAMRALSIARPVLLSPYQPEVNAKESAYLRACGIEVVHDVALALSPDAYNSVSPARWVALACEHTRAEADGFFLSCTHTTQIDAVAALEKASGKPVANSNQSALWASLKRVRPKLAPAKTPSERGRLFSTA